MTKRAVDGLAGGRDPQAAANEAVGVAFNTPRMAWAQVEGTIV
jgi:hypothetical protein